MTTKVGRCGTGRTCDLSVIIRLLCQLSYTPTSEWSGQVISSHRPPGPKPGALHLSYAPTNWRPAAESNREVAPYQGAAVPIEPASLEHLEGREGFEPSGWRLTRPLLCR